MNKLIENLTVEIRDLKQKDTAIALDFDGVCKLFTQHKHQIMRTCMFIHLYEFQRVPYDIFLQSYQYIFFKSEVAGRERFLCASRLSDHLHAQGFNCYLPGLHDAIEKLTEQGKKINAETVAEYADAEDVTRALSWSDEINEKVAKLTEIGLTPGISEYIFGPFREICDFYVVSTATEETLPPLMEKEGIDFILRYMGQETATKEEALTSLGKAGYNSVFMFGDSLEDSRASEKAAVNLQGITALLFVPVIPGNEEESFAQGKKMLDISFAGRFKEAAERACVRLETFRGKEVTA